MVGKGLCRQRSCDRALNLPGLDTTEKLLLDPDEDGGDNPLKARVIRRDVERRIYRRAAFLLVVVERSPDDLGEEGANCLARRQRLAGRCDLRRYPRHSDPAPFDRAPAYRRTRCRDWRL